MRSAMKKISAGILMMTLVALVSCSKKGSTGSGGGGSTSDPCKTDPTLSVSTTPANGTTEAAAVGPDFPLTVTISSTMPAGGVTIAVKAHPDGSTTNFFTTSTTSSTSSNSFTITGTPSATLSVVEVTVTSKACATNTWSGSYKYSKK